MLWPLVMLSCGVQAPLPVAGPLADDLPPAVVEAVIGLPDDYVPRTKHLNEDGSPIYVNRLLLETSPYLRQHAHNPVDWHPWGDEAFELAARLERPVLLSVGYSTCHWCHVMEEESFEDLEIAQFINEHYVAIKVDREERPDVDAVYMAAVHAVAGRGGWPMTVWLTPDRQPYYAGTYFPARDGDRGSRVGFLTALTKLADAYATQRDDVVGSAARLSAHIEAGMAPGPGGDLPGIETLQAVASRVRETYDPEHGGRAGAPKFPSTMPVRFLLREHQRTGDGALRAMATHTLREMSDGGIYDQLGGGFHRYSTDALWLAPHFEKMLYDNAMLAVAYTEAASWTGEKRFGRTARETLAWVEREMTTPNGGFASATDADSLVPGTQEREEGWFFTWTPDEVRAVLEPQAAQAVIAHFGLTDAGHVEGRSVLHLKTASEPPVVTASREPLLAARALRPPPLRDDKVLAAWNGLMIDAFARAALAFDEPHYAQVASRAADVVLTRMRDDDRLHRVYMDGQARHAGMIEDHAFMCAALISLFEATGEPRWLKEAIALDGAIEAHFEVKPAGGWFRAPTDGESLLGREKPDTDGAEPSGASVHVDNLLRLSDLTGDDTYRQRADKALRAYAPRIEEGAMTRMLLALDRRHDEVEQIVIVTPVSREQAAPFLAQLRLRPPRNHVLVVTPEAAVADVAALAPLARDKVARDGQVTAYVCVKGVCDAPTTDPEVFATQW